MLPNNTYILDLISSIEAKKAFNITQVSFKDSEQKQHKLFLLKIRNSLHGGVLRDITSFLYRNR